MKSITDTAKLLIRFSIIPIMLVFLHSCGDSSTGPNFDNVPPPFDTTAAVSDSTTEDGLKIYVMEEGEGEFEVVSRDQVVVFITGRTTDGEIFDSSYLNEATGFQRTLSNLTPVTVTYGGRQFPPLIEGVRRGVIGMKEGEARTLVIPPELGYGSTEDGPTNSRLADETLIFDIEVVRIVYP